jgi:hypothetical protein
LFRYANELVKAHMATLEEVKRALDEEEPEYAAAAANFGAEALDHLSYLAHGEDPLVASKAIYLVSMIPDPRSTAVLLDSAGSLESEVRVAVAAAAVNLSAEGCKAVVQRLFNDPDHGVRKMARSSASQQRTFGVWREGSVDAIFSPDMPLPGAGEPPLVVRRRYYPVHNIGHFQYLEASHVTYEGQPSRDVAELDLIIFPFDPQFADIGSIESVPVEQSEGASSQEIEEEYACDATGEITVTIKNLTSRYYREYKLVCSTRGGVRYDRARSLTLVRSA